MPTAMAGYTSTSAATANELDILGALPDSVLLTILSFLPTPDAVRTSILSRRWRYLWTSVGALELEFFYPQVPGKKKMAKNEKWFTKFVEKVLTFHYAPVLQRFRLFCGHCVNYPVEDWIRVAVTRNAQELDICLWHMNFQLPSRLFVSHSLVDLNLNLGDGQLRLPAVVDLPGLRSLRFCHVSFWDARLTSKLLASCTALRRLALMYCVYKDLECFEISCPLLESLTIDCRFRVSGLDDCQLKIFAPQLTFFDYLGPLTQLHAVKPLSSLADVEIELLGGLDKFDGQVEGFFHQLSSAKSLTIYRQCVEAMSTIPCSPVLSSFPFHSLKVLKVSARLLNDKIMCIILRLLVANPCLRVLSLKVEEVLSPHAYTEEYFNIFKVYSEQMSGVLEEVKISCPDLADPVLHLVKMLLGKEACLKRLLLNSHNTTSSSLERPNKRKRLLRKVLSFPRRSSNHVLAFL